MRCKTDEVKRILGDAALERMEALPGVALAYPDFRFTSINVVSGEKSEQGLAFGMPREASLTSLAPDLLAAGGSFTLVTDPKSFSETDSRRS